jgi:hypothetical protein
VREKLELKDDAHLLKVAAQGHWVINVISDREIHFSRGHRLTFTYEIQVRFTKSSRIKWVCLGCSTGRGAEKRIIWTETLRYTDSLKREQTTKWLKRFGA